MHEFPHWSFKTLGRGRNPPDELTNNSKGSLLDVRLAVCIDRSALHISHHLIGHLFNWDCGCFDDAISPEPADILYLDDTLQFLHIEPLCFDQLSHNVSAEKEDRVVTQTQRARISIKTHLSLHHCSVVWWGSLQADKQTNGPITGNQYEDFCLPSQIILSCPQNDWWQHADWLRPSQTAECFVGLRNEQWAQIASGLVSLWTHMAPSQRKLASPTMVIASFS